MSASYHSTEVIGKLAQDPELKSIPSGTKVCEGSIAVNETWRDKQTNEKREKVTWYKYKIWGRAAEIFHEYQKKGSLVRLEGTVEARAFMGNDGEPRASLELTVQEFKFLGGGDSSQNNAGAGQGSGGYDDYAPPPQELDDIPF